MPPPRRYTRSHFRRIYRDHPERAGGAAQEEHFDPVVLAAEASASQSSIADSSAVDVPASSSAVSSAAADFTGIPVATSSPDLADLMPAQAASASVSSDDPRVTGKNTVPPSTSGISDDSVSSLLAATSVFDTFQYTSYVATSTATSAPAAQQTGGGGDAMDEIEKIAQSKANELMGQMLPTLTLEVILEPTQVSYSGIHLITWADRTGGRRYLGLCRPHRLGWSSHCCADLHSQHYGSSPGDARSRRQRIDRVVR